MAEKKKLSVDEILKAARAEKGGGQPASGSTSGESPAPAPEGKPAEAGESPAPVSEGKPAVSGKKPGAMSVAEMLAAARAEKSGGQPAAAGAGSSSAESPAPAPEGKPAASGKKPGELSVAEMLAAARGEKSKPAAPAKPAAPKSDKPAAPAKAAPAATGAPKAAAPARATPSGPKDTASILAAARTSAKPGPVSKAEAAARGKPLPPPTKPAKPAEPSMPERPSYLRKPETTASTSRRTFFGAFGAVLFGSSLAIGFSSLAVTQLLWLLGLARFMFPNVLIEPPTVFTVGFPDDYAPGQVETKFVAQFGVWIVRDEYEGQAQIFALQTVCTHLGCTPNWLEGEQKFKCPCHGSGFYKDGVNFEGPAPRPLERYAIHVADDGQLEVDKSRTFQEEMGQWKDASSFVPV
jgi:cytochrome b6-f complex iron-sulfur subunit